MSATEDLLQDHVFIRRLQTVIEKCYAYLNESRDVPVGDIIKIADIVEQFVTSSTTTKKRAATSRRRRTEKRIAFLKRSRNL